MSIIKELVKEFDEIQKDKDRIWQLEHTLTKLLDLIDKYPDVIKEDRVTYNRAKHLLDPNYRLHK